MDLFAVQNRENDINKTLVIEEDGDAIKVKLLSKNDGTGIKRKQDLVFSFTMNK